MRKIKVLFLHEKLICGGAEQALYDLICLMDKNIFDVTVFTVYTGGEWEGKFREADIRIESFWTCQKKTKNPLVKIENWKKRKRISKAIKNRNIGIIEACFDEPFDIVVAYKLWGDQEFVIKSNAKTVKFIHNDLETNEYERLDILRMQEMAMEFDRVICVSGKAKSSFEQITGMTRDVVEHFNPLNSDRIREMAKQKPEYAISGKTICAVGRLSPEKGFERLIRIHKKIYDDGYKHKLVIVGDGPMRELLGNIIRSIHCEDSVELVGYQANPYPYMKNSEFLVCSSYTEGMPVIAMEALALGVPIVSAFPSISELFADENCGIITQNDDSSLEAGIRKMLADHEFYKEAKVGAEKKSQYFDGKRMVREIEKEFIELAASDIHKV